ncbi:MAG TPA: pilus assembly protein N-terminal domain-containing protein [Gemmatimonadaceae bacterium]|nr:pilus assembly protein N-terminal domain-containing protein [Gemmatimonadaceae bacterium]
MSGSRRASRGLVPWAAALLAAVTLTASARAQTAERDIIRVDLPIGRSYPIQTNVPVTRVSVATPEVADVAVLGDRDVVINAIKTGETDVLIYSSDNARRHYRVLVHSPADRMQVALSIKFAEVRRDVLREIGVSGLFRDQHTRVGTGIFRTDDVFQPNGKITVPASTGFLSVLTDFGTDNLLAFLSAEEQKGNARLLAEPTLLAANREEANFLAGGEVPVPVVQGGGGTGGNQAITIQYREFGVRLRFVAEILSDSLIKLTVRPEVSSLDFSNAVEISGFRIPALRTRRVESTLDVRRDESLIISGLFNEEREKVRTGIPGLMNIPILGELFSSTRFTRNQSELLVIVTPAVFDPMRPRQRDTIQLQPDTTLPAREAIEKRLPPSQSQQTPRPPRD